MIEHGFKAVRHGLMLGILTLIMGGLWAGYMATQHETLHGAFEAQQANVSMGHHAQGESGEHASSAAQHAHSGSLAKDAMQRLLRGHIHAMGLGVLVCVLLLVVALTSLRDVWKKVFAWSFGLGVVLYPPAWVIMGFRTVELGSAAAEASIMWLFAPAVGLLIGSMVALLGVLLFEQCGLKHKLLFSKVE